VSGGQGLIQVNNVDTATGTISYAAIRLNPAPAQEGSGVIASITFRGRAAGTSPVNLVSVMLSDRAARAIEAEQANGQVTVTCTGTPATPRTPGVPTATTPSGGTPTVIPGYPTPTRIPGQPTAVPGKECHYVVQRGDTLYSIARRYNTSVAAFLAANKLANPNVIYAGQKLLIPGCQSGGGPYPYPTVPPGHYPPPPTGDCFTHIVKPGETLYGIAFGTGDSVAGIASRNKLVNPNLIYAGQRLTVCPKGGYYPDPGTGSPYPYPGGKCRVTHVVKPGETAFRLALLYKTSVSAIAAANGLSNPNLIYAGQVLCIP
jgi:LysM repeat protein